MQTFKRLGLQAKGRQRATQQGRLVQQGRQLSNTRPMEVRNRRTQDSRRKETRWVGD